MYIRNREVKIKNAKKSRYGADTEREKKRKRKEKKTSENLVV